MNSVTLAGSRRHGPDTETPEGSLAYSSWLKRPLCRRYAFVQLRTLDVYMNQGGAAEIAHWHWAFAMHTKRQFEVLGAWPTGTTTAGQIAQDLRVRGVERLKLIATDAATSDSMPLSEAPPALFADSLCVNGVASETTVELSLDGRNRKALLLASSIANSLHASLERVLRRRPPFPTDKDAMEFIAQWLERADRSFFETYSSPAAASHPNIVSPHRATSRRAPAH